jgi:uncharacterized damage-inducible protein DinB
MMIQRQPPRVRGILASFDDAWSHAEESVASALGGLSDEEASWQPPGYRDAPRFPGMPPPGTVLWHIAHLEHSARHYSAVLRGDPASEEPRTPPPEDLRLTPLLASLERSHRHLREVISKLTDSDLAAACLRKVSVSELLRMIVRHMTWHAGQIVVARRLYRYRSGQAR